MKKIIVVAAIAAAATAGCGGSSSLPKDATGAPKLSAVAASIGCTGLKPYSQPAIYISATGRCKLGGRSVDLATFASDDLKQNWLKIATSFAPLVKDGPGWAAVYVGPYAGLCAEHLMPCPMTGG